ncbi:ABC transporter ATP-binding protein [Paractinoplanes hotanensis]|uniref:ABC transporter ATP-binding protein n=1 Tax=Paractinoplanes hotanensis TaxID=2906497 RepID=A0ABT0XTE7_9ACTN|nr:ABC transporter ATP-binding protein [Actinoplanes hotanensis]MCM4076457.1 ABC transporter ATP-binding protein [Actinoplanes hotanensis]
MTGFDELRLDGVRRRFGARDALAGLSLTIRRGEFIALLGPSGCGKSTALNCLAGLLPLSEGSIWQDGARLDTLPPERRGFGMVFQSYALFPHLSVRKNIAFGLQMRRLPRDEVRRRTEDAISLVRLEEHAKKLPGQLSGGQQQRVAIARAVVLEPSLVLMDEPLSNLDAKLRLEMRTEIRRLHQTLGLTTVYVTHDQEEALSLADRLVVLRDGRVEQIGTPEDLHERPANRHVADFMGYRNLLPMKVKAVHGPVVAVEGSGLTLEGTPVRDVSPGDDVVAGIRPEDLHQGGDGVPVTVEVVEYQGRELAVEARTLSGVAVHLRAATRPAPGDQITVTAAPSRVLVFPA